MSQPPPWDQHPPRQPQPGYGWGPPPGQQPVSPPPGSAPTTTRAPAVLWTGIAAVLLLTVAWVAGLYRVDVGPDLRQVFGAFFVTYEGSPTTSFFRPESISPVLGLMAWVVGGAVARFVRHRVVGLALAAAGSAVVFADTFDFTASLVQSGVSGGLGTELLPGGWLYLLVLPLAGASVVLALVAAARATHARRS